MKTFAGVVRVSHMGERKAGSESFHADREQVEAIKAVLPQGAKLDLRPPELDVSGGLPLEQRPSLREAVEGVEQGVYAGIIAAYQSRLFRNVEEEEIFWRRVEAAGGEVLLGLDGTDTKTVDGTMVRRIKGAVNAAERERHAVRFEGLREGATKKGIWQRRQLPRGYRKGRDRKLTPDSQAKEIRAAFADYLAGTTVSDLARRLSMTPSGIRQLLRNRVYLGELRVGQHVNPTAHKPLIDPDTFERVQRKLGEAVRPPRNGHSTALLSGLVRCPACGHKMSRTGNGYYLCRRLHSGGECPAPAGIKAAPLERYVEGIALAELDRIQVEAREGSRVTETQAALAEAERQAVLYAETVSVDDLGPEAYRAGARVRREAIEAATELHIAELTRQPATPLVGGGAEIWVDLNAEERNLLLRSLFALVLVRAVGRGRKVPVAERVRVIAFGTEVPELPRRGHQPSGIVPIPFPEADGVGVLGITASEDRLQAVSSAS